MTPEEENTFRALRDENLLVTSSWCRFGFHKWTKYDNPVMTDKKYSGKWFSQHRYCAHCNIASHRRYFEKDGD